jgi:hypothetical protein
VLKVVLVLVHQRGVSVHDRRHRVGLQTVHHQKNTFIIGSREINNKLPIDELTLLFGNDVLNDETNAQMSLLIQKFIQDTGRFTIN